MLVTCGCEHFEQYTVKGIVMDETAVHSWCWSVHSWFNAAGGNSGEVYMQ